MKILLGLLMILGAITLILIILFLFCALIVGKDDDLDV